ncbi:MAG: hypothetical protein ABI672_20885 [Vicinamibacteria bacterium]
MESDPPESPRATDPQPAFPGWRVRAAIYTLLLVAFTAPISLDPASRTFAQGPDTRLYLWTLGWDLHALKTDPLHIFNANIFFPEMQTLAYSEHLIGAALLVLPLSLVTSNLYLTLNFVLLLATFVTALGSDRLARECGASRRGALLAGIVGGFSGARLTRLTQAHLATLHFIPWTLAFAMRYLREDKRRDLLLTITFFSLQAITSGHGGLFLALALTLFLMLALALRRVSLMKLVRDCGVAGTLILMINLPFVIPYYEVKGKVGLTRVIEDAEGYAPSIGSWIQAPTRVQTALTSAIAPLRSAAAEANAALFPGFAMIGLATIASIIVIRRRKNLDRWPGLMVLSLAVFTLWLSLGPSFGLYRLAYAVIPGFDLIRVPSRLFLLTLTALSTLAALGLDQIRRPKVQWALILIATIECIPVAWDSPRDPITTPPIDSWLATQPTPFRVVELPIPLPDNSVRQSRFQSEFMIHGAAHWQPMVNGYSSLVPPFHMDLYKELYDFPTEKGLAALERIGVNYVVVHTEMYQPERWAEKEAQIATYGERIRLLKVEGEGRAFWLGPLDKATPSP